MSVFEKNENGKMTITCPRCGRVETLSDYINQGRIVHIKKRDVKESLLNGTVEVSVNRDCPGCESEMTVYFTGSPSVALLGWFNGCSTYAREGVELSDWTEYGDE